MHAMIPQAVCCLATPHRCRPTEKRGTVVGELTSSVATVVGGAYQ